MPRRRTNAEPELAAGRFSSWLREMQAALGGERSADVPCGSCTACCTASQFIHIGPEETDTLSRIPAELLFPAPLMPEGHVLLGYDERGHCPMLVDGKCSIYAHRPRTCRTYDCRVFAAAGLEIDDEDKVLIDRQARCWRFDFATPADRTARDAVRAAAAFLLEQGHLLPLGNAPATTTQLAVLAVELHHLFLRRDGKTRRTTVADPDLEVVRAEIQRLAAAARAPSEDGRAATGARRRVK